MFVKVDIEKIEDAIRDKSSFDALCLATFFKARYVNSLVYKHSIREIKAITHLGTERLSKCLKRGQKMGIITKCGDNLKVGKLHKGQFRYIRIEKDSSFKDIVKKIREGIILNRVNQVYFVKNMVVKANSPYYKFSKKELKQYRKVRHYMDCADNGLLGTIRKSALAKLIGVSKSTINSILKEMVMEKLISISPTFVYVGEQNGFVSLKAINEYSNSWFVTRKGNGLYCQVGNSYQPLVEVK